MKPFTFAAVMLVLAFLALVGGTPTTDAANASPPEYAELKAEAEAHYAAGSYAKARDLYKQAAGLSLSAQDKRWVDFRIADTKWRAQAGTHTHDSTIFDEAQHALEALIREIQREEDRDRVWAEANESLGDFWWLREHARNNSQAWAHYQHALDWWAGSSDIDLARDRYLRIIWTMADAELVRYGFYGYASNILIQLLDNALKIAATDVDKAHAQFLIASALKHQTGNWAGQRRVPKAYEAAIAAGRDTPWYDDALFDYARWLMDQGRPVLLDNGQVTREQDFVAALELLQRLVREFAEGQTPYWDQAKQLIDHITRPEVLVSVTNIFLPRSEIQYHLRWRNVKQIELTLHRVDLTRDIRFAQKDSNVSAWIHHLDLAAAELVQSWTIETQDNADHKPGQSTQRMNEPLPVGTYVLEAKGGGQTSREVIFVSDAAVVLKAAGDQILAYVCDAISGAPIADAEVRVWRHARRDRQWTIIDVRTRTDAQGLCVLDGDDFDAPIDSDDAHYLVAARHGDQQAVATITGYRPYQDDAGDWRLYVFTDRPAYRPEDTVQWKLIARVNTRDGIITPNGRTVHYTIYDPQYSEVAKGSAELNDFGSAWDSLALSASMPLGEYSIQF